MIFVFLVFSANNNEHILPKCRIIVGLHFLKLYISKRALKKKKGQLGRRRERMWHFPEGKVEGHRRSGTNKKLGN